MIGTHKTTGDLLVLHTDGAWTTLTDWLHEIPESDVIAVDPASAEGAFIVRLVERLALTEEMLHEYQPPVVASSQPPGTIYEFGKVTAFSALRNLLQDEYRRIEGGAAA